jgi:hypothetical protein
MARNRAIAHWRLLTQPQGANHLNRCATTVFGLETMPPLAPQRHGLKTIGALSPTPTLQPIGWVDEGHGNQKSPWATPVSGCWFVDAMNGARGRIVVRRRSGLPNADGKHGNRSGAIGTLPSCRGASSSTMRTLPPALALSND